MKRLIVINGARGIGKTSVAKEILKNLSSSILLDGDLFGNFKLRNEETEKIETAAVLFTLEAYLQSEAYENIIFVWTQGAPKIEQALSKLKHISFSTERIMLTGSECALTIHLLKDFSLGNLPLFEIAAIVDTLKDFEDPHGYELIDVSGIPVSKVTKETLDLLKIKPFK